MTYLYDLKKLRYSFIIEIGMLKIEHFLNILFDNYSFQDQILSFLQRLAPRM